MWPPNVSFQWLSLSPFSMFLLAYLVSRQWAWHLFHYRPPRIESRQICACFLISWAGRKALFTHPDPLCADNGVSYPMDGQIGRQKLTGTSKRTQEIEYTSWSESINILRYLQIRRQRSIVCEICLWFVFGRDQQQLPLVCSRSLSLVYKW